MPRTTEAPRRPASGDDQRTLPRTPLGVERATAVIVAFVILGAALAAAMSGAHPTGSPVADAMWTASFAGVVTLATATARRWTTPILGATSVALASGPLLGVALVGLGCTLAGATGRRRWVAARVLGTAVSINALLRVGQFGPHGTTAAITAASTLPLLLTGYIYAHGSGRRLARRGLIGLGAVLVIASLAGAVALLTTMGPAQQAAVAGREALDAGRSGDVDAARLQLREAGRASRQAVRHIDAWWARPALGVPVLAQQFALGRRVIHAADELTLAATTLSRAVDDSDLALARRQMPIDGIVALRGPLADARAHIDRAAGLLKEPPGPWTPRRFAQPADELGRVVDTASGSLETAEMAADVAPDLLGAATPRTYLVLFTTPAEARGLGGFVGNWALVRAEGGRIELDRTGRTTKLYGPDDGRRTLVGEDEFVARYGQYDPKRHLMNVTASPDFPTVGRVASQLYPQAGVGPVDGVISLDPRAVAALAQLGGPIDLPFFGLKLTPEEVEQFLLSGQYARFPERAKREEMLDALLSAMFSQFGAVDGLTPRRIVAALGPAVRGDHLLTWSPTETEERLISRLGVDGAFAAAAGDDILSVRHSNGSANKMDTQITQSVVHRATVGADGIAQATTTVRLESTPPPGLDPFVLGDDPAPGVTRRYLSLYTPLDLVDVSVNGVPVPAESHLELGSHVYSTTVTVAPGTPIEVQWRTSGESASGDRIHWDAQPTATPTNLDLDVMLADGRRITHRGVAAEDRDLTAR